MSEQITHLGVFDDCRRLALEADETVLCDEVKRILDERRESGRYGTLSRGNNENLVPGALKAREHWDERAGEDQFEREFAYVLGWYVHRATDRYFKPRFREVDEHYSLDRNRKLYSRVDGGEPRWLIKIYHDAVLYDEIYDEEGDPFHAGNFDVSMGGHPGSDTVDVPAVEELIQRKWLAELAATYECVAGDDGPPDVYDVDRLLNQRQEGTYYLTRWYSEAYHEPDPRHMEQFINEPNFYDETDPIVDAARSIQRGEGADETVATLLEDPGESQYAGVLKQAYEYLRAASDLFTGENTALETAEVACVEWMYDSNDDAEPHPTVDADPSPLEDLPLAEVAAVEDALSLAFHDDTLSADTRDALTEDPEPAHIGALAEPGPWLTEPLDHLRQLMSYRRSNTDAKLVFASGSLGHDAVAERFRAADAPGDRLARDVTVLRQRTTRGDPEAAEVGELRDLLEGLEPRIRQRWHTLRADKENYAPWSQRFFDWTDAKPDRLDSLAEAYTEGHTAGEAFYDPEDPLIRWARSTTEARTTSLPDLETALATADEQSTYAQALADVLEGIRTVDAYVREEIDEAEFERRIR